MQVADIVMPALALPDWTVTFVLVVFALGFPVVVFLAWIYELTPEGLKREHEVDRAQSITRVTGRKIDFLIIAVLCVAVVLLLVENFRKDETPDVAVYGEQTIAVLPFVNMGGSAETTVFSDGLAETLTHMLAQIDGLQVAARTSAFHFRDQTGEVGEIARQLNVRNLLEGSVQRWGDEISVTAQLIDAENGFHLWSGNYRRNNLDNIFAIQEDIAEQVVEKLHLTLLGTSKLLDDGGTDNIAAYEEFLQGRLEQAINSFESLPRAEKRYLRAIALDPDYGRAYVELVETYLDMDRIGVLPVQEALDKAKPYLAQARKVLGDVPLFLATDARYQMQSISREGPRASRAAESALLSALEQDPDNIRALTNFAAYLRHVAQRPAEAAQYAARGLKLDPRSERLLAVYGGSLAALGRVDEALEVFSRLREFHPRAPGGYYFAGQAEWQVGNVAEAVRWSREAVRVDPADHEIPIQVASALISVGDFESAERWIHFSLSIDPDSVSAHSALLDLFAGTGRKDEGLTLARRLLNEGAPERGGARWLSLWYLMDNGFRNGEFGEFYNWMAQLYPDLMSSPPVLNVRNEGYASLLVRVFLADGEVAKAEALYSQLVLEFAEEARQDAEANLSDEILLLATRGDVEKALQKLRVLEESRDYRFFWTFEIEPDLEPFRSTDEYRAIAARVHEQLEQQRKLILERGDNVVPR